MNQYGTGNSSFKSLINLILKLRSNAYITSQVVPDATVYRTGCLRLYEPLTF